MKTVLLETKNQTQGLYHVEYWCQMKLFWLGPLGCRVLPDLDVFGIVMGAFLRRLQIWCSRLYTSPNWVVISELLSVDL